ncbi:PHP-associated domain-containing protein [Isachenkonia alkalipeptolytica]|uniref:PHP domain-containing protein n=1 Tax=Isachenkonia alkalipeptolytica TaxID=2565777 RepID=A0AA44BEQ4_9CLOT|nr:PHP domain-containing protein [Isachenkonia alkalipeptolytica]NBG87791.1 PHP domain-containing protein [Isachenkonia alkalipeptolytica]
MIIDLHVHEKRHSGDSVLSLEDAVWQARKLGLDGICITDHDNNNIKDFAKKYSEKVDFPIFVGAEIFTAEGDFVVFGLDDIPEETLSAQKLLNLVEEADGVAIAAHPYRNNFRSLRDHSYDLEGFWAVEAFNGTTEPKKNEQALFMAGDINMPIIGASDAHQIKDLGKMATCFTSSIHCEKDLIEAIKSRQVYPVQWTAKGYQPVTTVKVPQRAVSANNL